MQLEIFGAGNGIFGGSSVVFFSASFGGMIPNGEYF